MRARTLRLVCFWACLAIVIPALAQEGHPLAGTWHGDWGPTPTHRNDVTVVLNWDGKVITGIINPGPNSISLQKASLDPSTWTIHFEADAKDHSGNTVHYVIDGKLENIGSHNRTVTGTWNHGTTKGDFKIRRD